MNGNTWKSYRFVTESDGSPPFLMEPQNPDFYPHLFVRTKFQSIGEYSSARMKLGASYKEGAIPEGIRIRLFNQDKPEEELYKIWHLSLEAFANNFLYTSITIDEFIALYKPILNYIIPDFVLMAETDAGELSGFLFALPDYAQGQNPDQLIVKTYASLQRGIGGALLDCIHSKAQKREYKTVIHALMHDGNVSKKHSNKFSRTFRRYTLYGKDLTP